MGILKTISAILLSSLLLTACGRDFEPDIKTRPVLCINSLITAGQPFDVSVTHTWLYSDTGADHSVKDAAVTRYANGQEVTEEYIAREGDLIKIVAESPTYGKAEAEVRVPVCAKARLRDATFYPRSVDMTTEEGYFDLRIAFDLHADLEVEDIKGEDNYFLVGGTGWNTLPDYSRIQSELSLGSLKFDAEPIFGEHIGVFESFMGSAETSTAFFTDRQFRGSAYTLRLRWDNFSYMAYGREWTPETADCGYRLTLHTVSQSYYDWALYLWQREEGPYGDMSDVGFSDPMWGYSNVSTGAGVVAAQSITEIDIPFADFVREQLQ